LIFINHVVLQLKQYEIKKQCQRVCIYHARFPFQIKYRVKFVNKYAIHLSKKRKRITHNACLCNKIYFRTKNQNQIRFSFPGVLLHRDCRRFCFAIRLGAVDVVDRNGLRPRRPDGVDFVTTRSNEVSA